VKSNFVGRLVHPVIEEIPVGTIGANGILS